MSCYYTWTTVQTLRTGQGKKESIAAVSWIESGRILERDINQMVVVMVVVKSEFEMVKLKIILSSTLD